MDLPQNVVSSLKMEMFCMGCSVLEWSVCLMNPLDQEGKQNRKQLLELLVDISINIGNCSVAFEVCLHKFSIPPFIFSESLIHLNL